MKSFSDALIYAAIPAIGALSALGAGTLLDVCRFRPPIDPPGLYRWRDSGLRLNVESPPRPAVVPPQPETGQPGLRLWMMHRVDVAGAPPATTISEVAPAIDPEDPRFDSVIDLGPYPSWCRKMVISIDTDNRPVMVEYRRN